MPEKLRITPITPCCDFCVLEAFTRAAFDYSDPFVVYSGLRTMTSRARRDLVEQLIANAEGEVVVVVSAPIPPECRREAQRTADSAPPTNSDEAAPSPAELEQILGMAKKPPADAPSKSSEGGAQ